MKVVLRPATAEDEAFFAELYAEVRTAEFASAGLPPAALQQLLSMQYRARTLGYATQFPQAESSIVCIGPHRIGRLLLNATPDELRLIDIALLEAYRGGGIGTNLLRMLQDRARRDGVPLRLSVAAGTPAARLYARLGLVAKGGDGVHTEMEMEEKAAVSAEVPSGQAGAAVPGEGDGDPAAEAGKSAADRVPPALSSEYFRSLTGSAVLVRAEGGAEAELWVESVTMSKSAQAQVDVNDSFNVLFTGPEIPMLAGMCTLGVKEDGSEELLLTLVPLGVKAGAMRYEAVFNRMRWTA